MMAGADGGTTIRHSSRQSVAAVQPPGLHDLGRERPELVAHPEDPEGQRLRGLRQDQRPVGVGQSDRTQVVVQRDDERLGRQQQAGEQQVEQRRLAPEFHPGEREAGQRGQDDGQGDDTDRDEDAGEHVAGEVAPAPGLDEVAQMDGRGIRNPPCGSSVGVTADSTTPTSGMIANRLKTTRTA